MRHYPQISSMNAKKRTRPKTDALGRENIIRITFLSNY